MNKGLFLHLMVSLIYALLCCYIVQDFDTDIIDRMGIVMFLIIINLFTGILCDSNDFYKQKI